MTNPLIKKLRDATGPSRELELEVWEALGRCAHRNCSVEYVQSDSDWTCDDCGADTNGMNNKVPRISSSLDAALALADEVLPDAGWLVGNELGECDAELFTKAGARIGGKRCRGHHKSPAIALLIAILQAQGETE